MKNSVFSEENVIFAPENFADKFKFFEFISQKAAELGYVQSAALCLEGLKRRESEGTTGFQDGFAIPHCKDNTVFMPKILFVRTSAIPWDSLDGSNITSLFVLLIPEDGAKEHLKLLAQIARSLIDDDFRARLKLSQNEQEIFEIIKAKLEV